MGQEEVGVEGEVHGSEMIKAGLVRGKQWAYTHTHSRLSTTQLVLHSSPSSFPTPIH